jgi:hypothetical protein
MDRGENLWPGVLPLKFKWATLRYTITYEGPALEGNEIAFRELAPALVSIADALEETNLFINLLFFPVKNIDSIYNQLRIECISQK